MLLLDIDDSQRYFEMTVTRRTRTYWTVEILEAGTRRLLEQLDETAAGSDAEGYRAASRRYLPRLAWQAREVYGPEITSGIGVSSHSRRL